MSSYAVRVGDRQVDCLDDGVEEIPLTACVHPGGAAAQDRALGPVAGPAIPVPVNFFLIRDASGTTLVDAGTGPGAKPELGHGRAAMAALGVRPDQVDRVWLTHLHFDHARGLLDGDAAWLPRAEIFVSDQDVAHFTNTALRDALPPLRQRSFRAAEGIVRAYHGRIRRLEPGPIAPGVEAIALPGHTPGQIGFLLDGPDRKLLFSADLFHLRVGEVRDPALCLIYDNDPRQTTATRRTIFARAAAEGWLLAATHVEGLVRVERDGDGFRLIDV